MADTRKTKPVQASHVNSVGWGAWTHDAKGNDDLRQKTDMLPSVSRPEKVA